MTRPTEERFLRFQQARDDRKALWLALRSVATFFAACEACITSIPPDADTAAVMFSFPRTVSIDPALVTAFPKKQKPRIPKGSLKSGLASTAR